jgi:hypothetical protein
MLDMLSEPSAAITARKRAMLHHLRHCDSPDYASLLAAYVERADVEQLYRLLRDLYVECTELSELEPVIELVQCRVGEHASLLREVFRENLRVAQLQSMRGELQGETERFALSLLLIAPPRTRLFELLRERYPDDEPHRLLTRAMRGLLAVDGGVALAPEFEGFELTEASVLVFEAMLTGQPSSDDAQAHRLRTMFEQSPLTACLFDEARQ